MSGTFSTIAAPAEYLYKEKGSRFIALAFPANSEEEVKKLVQEVKQLHPSATHHCYAFRLGNGGDLSRASDDGEPAGTAGKPILNQLLSRQLTCCLVVVVRYFGGTKLGVPGLIAAYKQAAAAVLDHCEVIVRHAGIVYQIEFSYAGTAVVSRLIKKAGGNILQKDFGDFCRWEVMIPQAKIGVWEQEAAEVPQLRLIPGSIK